VATARLIGRRVESAVRRLRDRTRLAVPSENEWLGLLGGRFGTVEEFLSWEAGDGAARLFLSDLPRPEAAEFFLHHPERRARVLRSAEQIVAHVFDLLGSGPRSLGAHLPWHTDFKSGHHWDRGAHAADLRAQVRREFGRGRDVRVPWTLSRFQHLPCLGQALWLGGDRRYFEEFRAQTADWIRENRPGFGINWTSTLEVSVRAANWCWAYAFFRPETLADREFASLFLRALFAHGRFVADRLDDAGPLPADYRLGGLVALLFLGVQFRGAPEADVWKGRAVSEIVRACEAGVSGSACDLEASLAGHRLRTEMLLSALLLARRSGFDLPLLESRVRGMVDFVAHYLKPDGRAPQIGDDDGRFLVLGEHEADRRDHRHLLALAGCAFDDAALFELAGERWEEAYWCFGRRCAGRLAAPAPAARAVLNSRIGPRPGLAVLRHGDLYAAIDAGPVGPEDGAQAHNDALSLEIQAAGEDLVVDPGTGVDSPDLGLRRRFRSTAAHNTIRVDGEEINPLPDAPFELPATDAPSIVRAASRRGFDLVEAEHRGYLRLPDPVLHRRVLLLNKAARRFVIEDTLEGDDRHRLEWSFHLAPHCEAVLEEGESGPLARCRAGAVRFDIRPSLLPAAELRAWLVSDLFSRGYGRTEPALTVRFEWTGRLPRTARFAIVPEEGVAASGGSGR
jgi:hypothetical protein